MCEDDGFFRETKLQEEVLLYPRSVYIVLLKALFFSGLNPFMAIQRDCLSGPAVQFLQFSVP